MSGHAGLPFERLEFIDDATPRGGAMNMALDEILLAELGDFPVLRIYRWTGPTISIGYFDPVSAAVKRWPEHEIVRRWTGGGIVEHGDDLTFSLLVPRSLPLAKLPAAVSYHWIHIALADALARAGCPAATLQVAGVGHAASASRACFENPVAHDILFQDQKIAGGAQRRVRRGLLHQGSIQTGAVRRGPWMAKLVNTLPETFGKIVERRRLSAAELTASDALAAEKYGASAWLRRF